MMLDQLHQEYGRMMISAEVLQGRIMEIKKRIVEEMQKSKKPSPDGIQTKVEK